LATCFGIVKQSSGHIEVETQLGKGTAFKIYFPQVPDPDEPIAIRNDKAKVAGGKETVLLVEDEIFVRQLAATVLRERGYTVIEAANGAEGLFFAPQHQGKIDLVLTDVVMPVMNGKEMADALRKTHPDTKVLFTSGYSAEVIGHHGVLEPGIEFLQKPFQGTALARRVREVLDR
jgi:CheY-like chemotaxis protein